MGVLRPSSHEPGEAPGLRWLRTRDQDDTTPVLPGLALIRTMPGKLQHTEVQSPLRILSLQVQGWLELCLFNKGPM